MGLLVVRGRGAAARGWHRLVLVVLVTAAGCSLMLVNRCNLPASSDTSLHHEPSLGGAAEYYEAGQPAHLKTPPPRGSGHAYFLRTPPYDPRRHRLQQQREDDDEDPRTVYTRHLLQQIAHLEEQVAALHAAAALSPGAATGQNDNAESDPFPRPPPAIYQPISDPPAPVQTQPPPPQHSPSDPGVQSNQRQQDSNQRQQDSNQRGKDTSADASYTNYRNNVNSTRLSTDSSCSALLEQQILHSEVVKGVPLNNEYEVVPFSHFSWSRVYPSELGLGKRVVEKPIGYRRRDLLAALTTALEHLNGGQGQRFSVDDFVEGSYRTIPTAGTQYELVFRDKEPVSGGSGGDDGRRAIGGDAETGHVAARESNTNDVSGHTGRSATGGSGLEEKIVQHVINSDNVGEQGNDDLKDRGYRNNELNNLDKKRNRRKNGGDSESGVVEDTGNSVVTGDGGTAEDGHSRRGAEEGTRSKNVTSGTKHSKGSSVSSALRTVTLMRPFAPISVVKSSSNSARQLINIILPLSGRLLTFERFMHKLTKSILPHDRRLFLTVVYFGDEGLQRARNIITKASREASFRMVKLLTLNETFSRGKALQVGAQHWSGGDVLLFMCDVDVVFSPRFLDRCRLHASPGRSVYYPVIFSLYNPGLVYPLQGKPIPEELDQLIISRDTGFWRDFGYGMTCQYRSDFLSVNGFDQEIIGWGGEDVLLYRKYVRSSLSVVRATDPGIFHRWHPKLCSPGLPGDQYRACLSSRALSEASHAHLGLVAFKKDLEKHPVAAQILPGINAAEKNLNSIGSYQATGEM